MRIRDYDMSVQLEHWLFGVDEYHRMLETGILTEDDRVELIEGEIVKMSPIGSRHVASVNRINALLNQKAGGTAIVSVQNPVRLDNYSEPQPDVALLKRRDDFYAGSLPTPKDVLLLVEVAETSREMDRRVKLPLYARANVLEVWLVNLQDDRIETHSEPANGAYQKVRIANRSESISCETIPGLVFSVDEILG
ncbi:MAG TPA: Uma2 family endonuclease [Blastocatellia bacterium]|nr:Uma2 family endonuclease [Blastocatellia bacterium]